MAKKSSKKRSGRVRIKYDRSWIWQPGTGWPKRSSVSSVPVLPSSGLVAAFPFYGSSSLQTFTDESGNSVTCYNGSTDSVEASVDAFVTNSATFNHPVSPQRCLKIPANALLKFTNNFTISVVVSDNTGHMFGGTNRYLVHKGTNDFAIITGYVASTVEMYTSASDLRTGSQILLPDDRGYHIITYSYNGSKLLGYRDDKKIVDIAKTGNLTTSDSDAFILNSDAVLSGFGGSVAFAVFYNIGLDETGILKVHEYLRYRVNKDCWDSVYVNSYIWSNGTYLMKHTPGDKIVLFDGDSLTYGGGGSSYCSYATTIPYITMSSFQNSDWYNFGIPGRKVTEALSVGATRIDPWFLSGGGKSNILTVWYGTNDIALNGDLAITAYNNLVTYCQARRTAGWKVIVLTMIDRTDTNVEAKRQEFNGYIRSNWSSFADGLADVASDSRIGSAGASANTVYFTGDTVHLNGTGNKIVADILKQEVAKLI